jgi:hypothetical protein
MPQKPHVLDYEAVTRSGMRGAFGRSDQLAEASWPQSEPYPAQDPPTEASKQSAAGPQGKTTRQATTLLKRGHAISYAGLVLFTALVYFRPYELFPSLKWTASSAFWVALGTLIVYVPAQLGLEGTLTIRPREINLVLLLLLGGLLSVPLAVNRSLAWAGWVEFVKVILMFIIMVNVVRSEARLKVLMLLILVISCWMSVAAMNDYRMGRFNLPGQRIEGIIGGLFDNPNDMALHLVTMVPIAIAFFLSTRRLLGKLIYPVCVGLMIAGIVASFSRGGFLGLVCATGVLMWRLARRNRALFLAIALVLCAGFIVLAPSDYRTRLATTGDGSSVQRQNDLKRSLLVLIHHPLLGVGMNNYVLFSNTEHATHNAYTQVGSEMGVPAMMVYILLLLSAIKPLRRIGLDVSETGRKSRLRYLAAGIEASLVGYMVASFFSSVAYLWYLYYLVGYAICLRRLYEAQQSARKQENDNRLSLEPRSSSRIEASLSVSRS